MGAEICLAVLFFSEFRSFQNQRSSLKQSYKFGINPEVSWTTEKNPTFMAEMNTFCCHLYVSNCIKKP